MNGESDLNRLLTSLSPELAHEEFVFCTLNSKANGPLGFQPRLRFEENEGTTIICTKPQAQSAGLQFTFPCRLITLTVHSSLEAVGLIAAVTTRLAQEGISANVISGYFHDHLFVPSERAEEALRILKDLAI